MGEEKDKEKVCYQFICARYPKCDRARGQCCAIEKNEDVPEVAEGECTEDNGYPLFVPDHIVHMEDGDVDQAVEELVWGRMYNTGQVCCASKRFLVHNSIKDEFAAKVVDRIKKIKVGVPSEESSQMGCLISEKAAVKVEKEVERTVEQGGKIVLGGHRNGAYYEPTVIVDVPKTADVAYDMEIFGPVVPIIGFDTEEEAIEIANQSKFGLSSCVFSKDAKTAMRVASRMEAGGAVINGASFFRSFELPFGGWKQSGIGTEGVFSTFNEMTKAKNIILKNIY